MTGTYTIRRLPKNYLIDEHLKTTRKGKCISLFEIGANTFKDIPYGLKLRPRAVRFAIRKNHFVPQYVVLYNDSKSYQCLFLFNFKSTIYQDGQVLEICRCLGNRRTKRHWKAILKFINDNNETIRKLTEMETFMFNLSYK